MTAPKINSDRAGIFISEPSGYKSYLPKKLPPFPDIIMDSGMIKLMSEADGKLGRLDGITQILPNPELFVAMYVNKEAVLSSQIEGTQASFIDLMGASIKKHESQEKVIDIVNYVDAVNYGLERIKELPLSLRLLKEIHSRLLKTGRGSSLTPGEFRTSQNWIGAVGSNINTATFVPPAVPNMLQAMYDLENFMHVEDDIPILIKIAMIHSQFETIHPFLDGNGRMGRLLITFLLCQQEILTAPLLYLSYYFKLNRADYYDKLMDVRTKGDFEGWIKFFLAGVSFVSDEAVASAKNIIALNTEVSGTLSSKYPANNNYQRMLKLLFEQPIVNKRTVADQLKISFPTASSIVDNFVESSILVDYSPDSRRNKSYLFDRYMKILQKGTEL
ncbi:MAG: Fic family protein [Clostridiales Family XIII bacterium]|nr:Fic family protein [Clostridiales Family XIII bacterium]